MQGQKRIFNHQDYLHQYYQSPQGHPEEGLDTTTQTAMHQAFNLLPNLQTCLQIGCGPTLIYAAIASRKCKQIYLSQYNTDCFKHINAYLSQTDPKINSFWTPKFSVIARLQQTDVETIEKRLRSSIFGCFKCDLTQDNIVQVQYLKKVDIVTSSLCIEAVAKDLKDYSRMIKNIKTYLKKGGYIFLHGVLEQTFYMVKDQRLPCLQLTEANVQATLKQNNFEILSFSSLRPQNPPTQTSDFKGVFTVLAKSLD